MKTVSATKIAAQFDDYLEVSREQPVLVTRNGKPVAVLLAVQDKAEAEQLAFRRSRSLRSVLEEGGEQIQKGGGIPHDQFWREVAQSRRAKRATPSRARKADHLPSVNDTTVRWRFSLAALLRTTTLVSMALGWMSLLATVTPHFVVAIIIILDALLAIIVGWRRSGSNAIRVKAAIVFFIGGVMVACCSGFIADIIQDQRRAELQHPWQGLDLLFDAGVVVFGFPIVLLVLVFMLRASTWSAHDSSMRSECKSRQRPLN